MYRKRKRRFACTRFFVFLVTSRLSMFVTKRSCGGGGGNGVFRRVPDVTKEDGSWGGGRGRGLNRHDWRAWASVNNGHMRSLSPNNTGGGGGKVYRQK